MKTYIRGAGVSPGVSPATVGQASRSTRATETVAGTAASGTLAPLPNQSALSRCEGRASLTLLALVALWLSAAAFPGLGAPAIPTGVPEPGLIVWGSVVNATNPAQNIAISTVSWSVTDGTKTAVYSGLTRPATRILTLGGKSYYVMEIPFDTRRFGSVTLADPATQGLDSFELKPSSPPTYTLTPTINGVLATVQSVDGAPSAGNNTPVAGFTATTRGRVIRVDLAIVPTGDGYEAWATAIFGSANLPQAARTADPDGDGLTNEGEFAAGTDPLNAASALRILTLRVDPLQNRAILTWQSVSGKNYRIESATSITGVWSEIGQMVPGGGTNTQTDVGVPDETVQFYRVRVIP